MFDFRWPKMIHNNIHTWFSHTEIASGSLGFPLCGTQHRWVTGIAWSWDTRKVPWSHLFRLARRQWHHDSFPPSPQTNSLNLFPHFWHPWWAWRVLSVCFHSDRCRHARRGSGCGLAEVKCAKYTVGSAGKLADRSHLWTCKLHEGGMGSDVNHEAEISCEKNNITAKISQDPVNRSSWRPNLAPFMPIIDSHSTFRILGSYSKLSHIKLI